MIVDVAETDRQMLIMALAHLATERPGWDFQCLSIAEELDGHIMFEQFKLMHSQKVDLLAAFDELVKLQAHYAELLNMHDGGTRRAFKSPEEWIERYRELRDAPGARG